MQLTPSYPILTRRLTLRPLTGSDADQLLSYRGDAGVCRYLPFEPMTRDVLDGRLRNDFARTALTDKGQALTLGAEDAATGRLIGDVVLFWHSARDRSGELGYVFHPEAGGRGYATEACAAVLGLAFEHLRLHRVVARIEGRNRSSARLAERLGMRLEAQLIQHTMFKGEWSDGLIYAMLAAEWPASPAAARR